ncbi:DUF1330 domain-containing protein [Mycolicibacterium smegmatis]|uniref:DUF1330 domain-containing protein n=1 Tax=Mycolicibacterium smegmatis (strain MKD8) TaxID=1214915 RepID=A0A2U9PTE9_MYCSE|nr:DUF1330 domain-containing protein [Mycolicibacterium smegmatis]AWT55014.1 hypothetical protein D806_040480 [Mycolicibacterium smegmatis MKD8]
MPAYVISDIEIVDPAAFEEYKTLSPPSVVEYGGRFLARGGDLEILEGDWVPKRLAILEFPDVNAARAWLESVEYAPARKVRQGAAKTGLVLVSGVPG